jgi:hypothetical protein
MSETNAFWTLVAIINTMMPKLVHMRAAARKKLARFFFLQWQLYRHDAAAASFECPLYF